VGFSGGGGGGGGGGGWGVFFFFFVFGGFLSFLLLLAVVLVRPRCFALLEGLSARTLPVFVFERLFLVFHSDGAKLSTPLYTFLEVFFPTPRAILRVPTGRSKFFSPGLRAPRVQMVRNTQPQALGLSVYPLTLSVSLTSLYHEKVYCFPSFFPLSNHPSAFVSGEEADLFKTASSSSRCLDVLPTTFSHAPLSPLSFFPRICP